MRRLLLAIRTIRYLKVSQVFHQLLYRVTKIPTYTIVDVDASPRFKPWQGHWFGKPTTNDGVHFTFLGVTGVASEPKDWNSPNQTKLWLYNLHYLNDLSIDSAPLSSVRERLIQQWVLSNPVELLGNGWEPYTLSLRSVNIVKWLSREGQPDQNYINNLALQARVLSKRIEYHILGNHLFANAKALVFVGCYLDGAEADKLLNKGLELLDFQIDEQFLSDGAHFELSPMYHSALLWDICDLIQLAQSVQLREVDSRLDIWRDVLTKGLTWLASVLHPDRAIPFFNDASFDIAPTWDELSCYAEQVGCGSRLPSQPDKLSLDKNSESGLMAISWNSSTKAIVDVGNVGPDYQPGHAHADSLSFELSVHGYRLFTNSGTSEYGESTERLRQRSTIVHNTIDLDGENSSEVWGGFRVARRAKAEVNHTSSSDKRISIEACHDGYTRLRKDLIHTRQWEATPEKLVIKDSVPRPLKLSATSRMYVHPDVHLEATDSGVTARLPDGQKATVSFEGAQQISISGSTWHPSFGASISNKCIVVTIAGHELVTSISW